MKREIAIATAGLSAALLPKAAAAQPPWAIDHSPYPRRYEVDTSCGMCETPPQDTISALASASGTWSDAFYDAGWGGGYIAPGSGDLVVQFRYDFWDVPGVPQNGCGVDVWGGSTFVCDPSVLWYNEPTQQALYTHEFGHSLGIYNDPTQYNTVMSSPAWTNYFTGGDYWGFDYYYGFYGGC